MPGITVRRTAQRRVQPSRLWGLVLDAGGEKYLVGECQVWIHEFNELVSEVSGAAVPSKAPSVVTSLSATLTTWPADLTEKPSRLAPLDYVRVIRCGCWFDGGKAESALGLVYTPIRETIREAIESLG